MAFCEGNPQAIQLIPHKCPVMRKAYPCRTQALVIFHKNDLSTFLWRHGCTALGAFDYEQFIFEIWFDCSFFIGPKTHVCS